jgi:periplasmic divalent cation tolerance protein
VSVVTVYAVFANAEEAERIGRTMIEERLAACVNILGACRSIYRWEGEVETADEVPALFKTRLDKADAVIARIAELHSYANPAIAAWPIAKLPAAYADWVESNVG